MHRLDYDQLCFPVLWIGERDARASFELRHLRSGLLPLRKAGFLKSGCLVDSHMQRWKVEEVVESGVAPWFFGYRWPGGKLLLLDYLVDSPPVPVTISEVADLIHSAFRRGKHFRNMVDSPARMKDAMKQCRTFKELLDYFRIRPKPAWKWYVSERGSM